MTPKELREGAMSWHEAGDPVLPVIFRPKKHGEGTDKIPLVHYQHWKDGTATQTTADVAAMPWARAEGVAILLWPTTNRIVLDLDGEGAEKLLSKAGIVLPQTGIMYTRNGKHYHFTAPPGAPPPNPNAADRDRRKIALLHATDEKGQPCKPAVDLLLLNGIVVVAGPGYREDPEHPVDTGHLAEIPREVLTLARSRHGTGRGASDASDGESDYASLLRGAPDPMRHGASVRLIGHLLPKLGRAETWAIMEDWCDRCTPPADKRKVRANFEDILRREGAKGNCSEAVPVVVRLADVKAEPVSWLWAWAGRIPRGKLSLIIGDPDQGKSFLTLDMAARVTRGADWPDGTQAPLGDVVLLTAEDGLADTVRPRLDAMGGDPERVHVIRAIRDQGGERGFDLTRDLNHLEATITEYRPALVVIDPISAYMGKVDSFRDADVRRVLAPLAALAERTGVAIVAVMHLTKDAARAAIHRAQGSVAFVGAARAVFAVAGDKDKPERRLFVSVKMNITTKPPALAFRLHKEGQCAKVVWESQPIDVNVEALLDSYEKPGDRMERQEATEFLKTVLAGGPLSAKEVQAQAEAQGISKRTLVRAKETLGVKVDKTTFTGGWVWRLPTEDDSPKGATPPTPKSATSPKDGELAFFAKTQQLSGLNDKVSPKSAKVSTIGDIGTLGEDGDRLEEVSCE